jgi:hypothetical protein
VLDAALYRLMSQPHRPDDRKGPGSKQYRARSTVSEKKRLIDLYAADELPETAYVDGNIVLDQELRRLTAKRAALLPVLHNVDAVGASVRYFCETARARLENCHDFESKRQFLADYIGRVVYTRYKVTVRGLVPIMRKAGEGQDQSSGAATLEFQIEGEIKGAMLHGPRSRKFPDDNRMREWGLGGQSNQPGHCAGFS